MDQFHILKNFAKIYVKEIFLRNIFANYESGHSKTQPQKKCLKNGKIFFAYNFCTKLRKIFF